jgi:ABC-type transport system involved in multi-copper enzyme maturation permease subunit
MIWTIAKWELLEYLKSLKFMIGLGISVVLMTIITVINIKDYKQSHQDYLDAKQEISSSSSNVQIYRSPQVLSILVQGKDRKLGNRIELTPYNLPSRTSGYMSGYGYSSAHYSYSAGFSSVDFAFVIRVVLSLMVIFLTYNAISEEKFKGTLRLLLANRLPRDQLLLGKSIGGLIVVLGSLSVSSIIALLIILLNPSILLLGSDWIRILALFGISALYLVCFYTLSLFISVVANRPSTALMILLQIWIFLIIIYPNVGVILAENTSPLPNDKELTQLKTAVFQPYDGEYKKANDAYQTAIRNGDYGPSEIASKYFELSVLRAEKYHQVDMEFGHKMTQQMSLAQLISTLSPGALFDEGVDQIAKTGITEYERFMQAVFQYWQQQVEHSKLMYTNANAYLKTKLPEFNYISEPLTLSFLRIIPQVLILIVLSIIFFALAHTSFLHKDVR